MKITEMIWLSRFSMFRERVPSGLQRLDRPIIAAGGQEFPIGAPGNGPDLLRMPLKGIQALAVGHRPDPRRLVERRSGQPAGIGSEGNTVDGVRVSLEDALALPGGHVPDPRRVVVGSRGQEETASRRNSECERMNHVRVPLEHPLDPPRGRRDEVDRSDRILQSLSADGQGPAVRGECGGVELTLVDRVRSAVGARGSARRWPRPRTGSSYHRRRRSAPSHPA